MNTFQVGDRVTTKYDANLGVGTVTSVSRFTVSVKFFADGHSTLYGHDALKLEGSE